MDIVKSLFYFLLAGIFEIGGGYLMWLWLRGEKSLLWGLAGAVVLALYGVIPTLQPEGAAESTRHMAAYLSRSRFYGGALLTAYVLMYLTLRAAPSR